MNQSAQYKYILSLPSAYEKLNQELPLILFLHGMGERGIDLELIKRHGPPKLVNSGMRPGFLEPFIILSPQCPADEKWKARKIIEVLDQVHDDLRVDTNRIYLTGISMGGYGAWKLAIEYPDRFAALSPICGKGKFEAVKKLANLPIWMIHSADDKIVPVSESDKMFAALQNCNASDLTYTRYGRLSHVGTWENVYSQPMLYEWFLKYSRFSA